MKNRPVCRFLKDTPTFCSWTSICRISSVRLIITENQNDDQFFLNFERNSALGCGPKTSPSLKAVL